MSASLIRSRAMVTHAIDRYCWNEMTDGAVLQEDGAIVEIGTYRDLSRRHPNVAVIGSGNEVMLPGFVNAHHHIGLTPLQSARRTCRSNYGSSLAWASAASTFTSTRFIRRSRWSPRVSRRSSICTVVSPENSIRWSGVAARRSAPTRMSGCGFPTYAVRDQNRLVYQRDEDFRGQPAARAARPDAAMVRALATDARRLRRAVREPVSPATKRQEPRARSSLRRPTCTWCLDAALARLAELSRHYNVPLHMHLVETAYQKEYASRRGGGTAVEYIDRFGLLGPQMTPRPRRLAQRAGYCAAGGNRDLRLSQLLVEL